MIGQSEEARITAANVYNAAADHFDDAPLGFWDRYGRKTVERLSLAAGASVLDVACGTGASALPAAETVGPDGPVLGVDLAENLLDLARAKAAQRDLDNIEFQLGDMTDLGYPDGHFDAVVCVFAIFFVPDMESLVAELWRMVRPGGKLAVTTWGPDVLAPVYAVWLDAVKAERPDLHSAFNPWDRIVEPLAVLKLMQDGGVVDPEVVPEDGVQPIQSPEDFWTIALGTGLRGTIDAMGAEAAARVRDTVVNWTAENQVEAVGTNVIYAVGTK